ncbi:MAG: ABC transporter permease [Bryobacterales bacterium]|nr:ABC transporter permease [Bryobacterales bacterium]MBV9396754.1 ABC transporter permease [Bryobacterales bacterium]
MIFLLRKALISLIQFFVISIAVFLFFRLLPGDIYTVELENPQISKASLEGIREAHGLTQSWPRRYVNWLASSAKGDFGDSLAYGIPVRQLLAPRIRGTLEVAIPALLLSWALGLGGAISAGVFGIAPTIFEPGATAATIVPDVAAVSLILWAAVWLGISITGIWLPIAGLTFGLLPVVVFHSVRELRHAQKLEFVRIAESRGISGSRIWLQFVLRAALNPLVSLAGLSVAAAISSSFVVEVLTGWPGIGPLFLEAVQARDYSIVQTVLVMLAGVLIVSNFAAEIALYRLDPRIRLPHERFR